MTRYQQDRSYKTRELMRWLQFEASEQIFKSEGITFKDENKMHEALYEQYSKEIKIRSVNSDKPLSKDDFNQVLEVFYDGLYYYRIILNRQKEGDPDVF